MDTTTTPHVSPRAHRANKLATDLAQTGFDARLKEIKALLSRYGLSNVTPEIRFASLKNYCGCDRTIRAGSAYYFYPHLHSSSEVTKSVSSGVMLCGTCARLIGVERPIEEREIVAKFTAPKTEWVEGLSAA